jgi:outer membrane protein OmpA-like peptidoglycan-associated protein
MASAASPTTSAYADAKANIRDTVKWLAASFAAIAAVVVAGSSLSGIGQLELGSWRLWVALAALAIGFLCVARALYRILQLLRADGLFASDLANASHSDAELQPILDVIQRHHTDLLPHGYGSFRNLWEKAEDVKGEMDKLSKSGQANQPQFKVYEQYLADLEARIYRLLDFALYMRQCDRVEAAQRPLFFLGGTALVALAVFAYAANPPKTESTPAPALVILDRDRPGPETTVQFPPVRFATGSAKVSTDGLDAIAKARDFAKANGEYVLLLRAYTDTVASDATNRTLARRRADEVRRLLLEPGGLPPTQVYVTELSEKALPRLTKDEVAEERNRSVEILVGKAARIEKRAAQ